MKVMSWATFNKKYKPQKYKVSDGTLGIYYSVEPTMIEAGFTKTRLNFGDQYFPENGTPKQQVLEEVEQDEERFKNCRIVVYHQWYVRREHGTSYIDIYYK